jgi:hypothetical protein
MGEVKKPKRNPAELKEEWVRMVNDADWLTIPGEKGILMGLLNDPIVEIAIDSGNPDQFIEELKMIRPDLVTDTQKINFKRLPYEYLLIIKLLSGETEKAEDLIAHSRDKVEEDFIKRRAA